MDDGQMLVLALDPEAAVLIDPAQKAELARLTKDDVEKRREDLKD